MGNTVAPVVVTEERKNRRGLIWLGIGAVALLSGGSTFALWSANDAFAGGTITAGDLNLVEAEETAFYDVSTDRADADTAVPGTGDAVMGHLITDPTAWRAVPGDEIAAAFSADVTMEGDNLVAALKIDGAAETDGNASLTWGYEVYQAGNLLTSGDTLPADGTLLYLSAPEAGQNMGDDDAKTGGTVAESVYTMADTTEDFTVVLTGTFDETAGDAGQVDMDGDGVWDDQTNTATGTREDATLADALNGMVLQLDQVRDTGAIFQ